MEERRKHYRLRQAATGLYYRRGPNTHWTEHAHEATVIVGSFEALLTLELIWEGYGAIRVEEVDE